MIAILESGVGIVVVDEAILGAGTRIEDDAMTIEGALITAEGRSGLENATRITAEVTAGGPV